jgi:hypothetical protein
MDIHEADSLVASIDDPHARNWAIRWRRIIAVATGLLLACYIATWLLALPGFVDRAGIWFGFGGYSESILWGLFAVGLVHLLANVLLSIEEAERPTRWAKFLRDFFLFLIIPAIPVFGIFWQVARLADVTVGDMGPSIVARVACAMVAICPVITFLQLRKLALRIGEVRLARFAVIVAIADPIVLALTSIPRLIWPDLLGIRLPLEIGAMIFLVPRAALLFFALASVYVLFEMAGHYFNSARRTQSILLAPVPRPA